MDAAINATREQFSDQPTRRPRPPSWSAMAAVVLSLTLPVCGWMVSLSNRVASLEEKTSSLATAAQMAEVKQKIDDWIQVSSREHYDDRQHTDDQVRELRRTK